VSASVNLPCTIKSRSSLLGLAHAGGPGKRAVKRLWCGGGGAYCFKMFLVVQKQPPVDDTV